MRVTEHDIESNALASPSHFGGPKRRKKKRKENNHHRAIALTQRETRLLLLADRLVWISLHCYICHWSGSPQSSNWWMHKPLGGRHSTRPVCVSTDCLFRTVKWIICDIYLSQHTAIHYTGYTNTHTKNAIVRLLMKTSSGQRTVKEYRKVCGWFSGHAAMWRRHPKQHDTFHHDLCVWCGTEQKSSGHRRQLHITDDTQRTQQTTMANT